MARSASKSEYDLVATQFRAWDVDDNGTIDRAELGHLLQRLDPQQWTTERVDNLLHSVDRDGDGRISLHEFLSWTFSGSREEQQVRKSRFQLEEDGDTSHASECGSPVKHEPSYPFLTMNKKHAPRVYEYYKFEEVLGTGAFATVSRAHHRSTGQLIAAKAIVKDELSRMRRQPPDALVDVENRLISAGAEGGTEVVGSLECPPRRLTRLEIFARVEESDDAEGHGGPLVVRVLLRRGTTIVHSAEAFELRPYLNNGSASRVFPARDGIVWRGRPGDVVLFQCHRPAGGSGLLRILDFGARLFSAAQGREVPIMQTLNHPNIVRLLDVFEDFRHLYICEELCEGGELFDLVVEVGHLSESDAAILMRQAVSAVHHMHSRQLMHRDLRLENMLLQLRRDAVPLKDNVLKVIDFGYARNFCTDGGKCETRVGSPHYMPPEMLAGAYDEACDVWSLGIIAYILLCGRPPFDADSEIGVWCHIREGSYDFTGEEWDLISDDAKSLVAGCLQQETSARFKAARCLNHTWLSSRLVDLCDGHGLSARIMPNLRSFWAGNVIAKLASLETYRHIHPVKLKELNDVFEALDVDHSGDLSPAELRDGLERAGIGLGMGVAGWRRWLENTFGVAACSPEGDGGNQRINYSTFLACVLDRKLLEQENVCWAIFRSFDSDNSGQISLSELRNVLQDSGLAAAMGTAEPALAFEEIDLNHDGEIDFFEFMETMRRRVT